MNNEKKENLPMTRILKAFQKLNKNYVLHESIICELLYMGFSPRAEKNLHRSPPFPSMPIPSHPASWKECSLNTSVKEIAKIKNAAKKLLKEFEKMHQTTIACFVFADAYNFEIEKILKSTIEETDKATRSVDKLRKNAARIKKQEAKSYKKNPELNKPALRVSKKSIGLHIAKLLADEYYKATDGKSPTVSTHEVLINKRQTGYQAYGDFFELVKSVFNALSIKESAENKAREAARIWKANQMNRAALL